MCHKSKGHLIPALQDMSPQVVIHISTPAQILLEALWQETRAGPSLYSIARDIFELVPSCLKDDSQVWVLFNCSLEYYLLGGGSERAVLSSGCPVVPPHAATDWLVWRNCTGGGCHLSEEAKVQRPAWRGSQVYSLGMIAGRLLVSSTSVKSIWNGIGLLCAITTTGLLFPIKIYLECSYMFVLYMLLGLKLPFW